MTLAELTAALRPVAGEAAPIEARWMRDGACGDLDRLQGMLARRLAREPLDRILGSRGFWTLDLKVTPATLSPRPDTETVVDLALAVLRARTTLHAPLAILDLGTGTGAILLALMTECPLATGVGVDLSPEALAVARGNAETCGLADRARFLLGDWDEDLDGRFDLIVSNPPYIPSAEIETLDPEVKNHDPRLALDGGPDGLDAYRRILRGLAQRLTAEGVAVLEFGLGQAPDVSRIARENGLHVLEIRRDLAGHERAVALSMQTRGKDE